MYILTSVNIEHLSTHFELLHGRIEDVILDGVSQDKVRPFKSHGPLAAQASFFYDVVNLDFCGGMGNRDKNQQSRWARALKKLIERQQGTSFTLVLTLNVRDKFDDELASYLKDTKYRASTGELRDTLAWYETCGDRMHGFKLKAVVPLFIRQVAEINGFECFCYAPIAYTGTGRARMVHFVFELTATQRVLAAFSRQSEEEVIKFVFLGVEDGTLCVLDQQHLTPDYRRCPGQLSFLPEPTRLAILTTMPRIAS